MNTAEAVLCMLRDGKRVSGEAIATKLKVSRTAVWKAIGRLRKTGYTIEGDAKGYILREVPDLLLPFEISNALLTKVLGKDVEHHMTIGSTNERARELAEEGRPEGTLVISEVQEGGKGRLGRSWASPEGGIWMSLILRPGLHPNETAVLTLAAGVAVAEALRQQGLEATLKWPNDILIDGRKVCGLLAEMSGDMDRVDYMVIGFGINANFPVKKLPRAIREQVTTLEDVQGSPVDRRSLAVSILKTFEGLYLSSDPGAIIGRWKGLASTLGQRIRITTPKETIQGTALDIGPSGALIIRSDTGEERTVYSGDCQHLRKT